MTCFLQSFILSALNGILLIGSAYISKSAVNIFVSGLPNESLFQTANSSRRSTVHLGGPIKVEAHHTSFRKENILIPTEIENYQSFRHARNAMDSNSKDSGTEQEYIPRISNDKSLMDFSSSNTTYNSPTFIKSFDHPSIIFFKRVSVNGSSNGTEDGVKLNTFLLNENCSETCELVLNPTNKYQTVDELVTEIFESLKKEFFEHRLENETKYYDYYPVTSNTSDISNFLGYNLTVMFDCYISQNDELKITCYNVSLYEVSEYIPVETRDLDISDSPAMILTKPLFPHLTNLTTLRLHNNRHRYITRAFTGLQRLESLDLSKNNIQVLFRKLFDFTPNLKSLNLSMNSILRLETIAIALGKLQYFENLTLDNNLRIKRILKSELEPLRNTKLLTFSLFSSTLNTIEKGAFKHLPFLKILDLSLNYMNENALTNVTSSVQSSLEYLGAVSLVGLNWFPVESLLYLQNTSIYRLDLSSNFFTQVPELPSLPSLKSLWLSYCSLNIIQIGAFDNLPNLEELVLSNNELITHPVRDTSLNNLRTLILKRQVSRYSIKFSLPDFAFKNSNRLEILDLSNTLIDSKLSRYSLHGLKSLRLLDLSVTKILEIEDYAFETLFSLEFLVLNGNSLRYLTNFTFFGLQNLTHLYLSSNYLQFSYPVYPLKHLPFLMTVFFHNNKIVSFPKGFFSSIYNLKVLIMSNNALVPWSEEIFNKNSSLTALSLSGNQLSYVTPSMLSDFKQVNEFLDITRNPFNCSVCGMEEFQHFLKSSNLTFNVQMSGEELDSTLMCTEPAFLRGQPFLDIEMTLIQCSEMQEEVLSLFSLLIIVLALLFITIAICMCYFFRWYIRYWVFHVKAKVKEKIRHDFENEQRYAFDAFVSYNSHDNYWIAKYLVPSLEHKDPKYKLCVHERDFQVGRLITENILEAIEASRNVILILTEDFIKSEWCMFELHMAQHRLFDDTRDCLILVKLKDIDRKIYTKNLMYLEKTRTCLTWTEDKTGQKLFWERMRRALGHPLKVSFSTDICIT
ncbi:toll-like receptor 2 [Argiope bruennichi]|uniref:Toll-like receptor 2 like protein n=1 Tax=Argiope bruennichi TaxID=94029 RepID=A0A8T0FGT5_ARGBR|nr:toll-like receptor 2 [Argiope bruennichi]XP_055929083.1 toll-like receptor 2 [Argiope bruennichi]KAF8790507.1 Toll-like receptor 2 like protein [Argiope bruennichi]